MVNIMKQYKIVKDILGDDKILKLTDEEALRYQDVLRLLETRGYIHSINADGVNWYHKMADCDGFEEWLKEEIKEEKRLSRREWTIGIVCAIIGAAVGLIPCIVSMLQELENVPA